MMYTDDLMRHIEDKYTHIHLADMEEADILEVIECWRDHDVAADGFHNIDPLPDTVLPYIQRWLTNTYEVYLEESYK